MTVHYAVPHEPSHSVTVFNSLSYRSTFVQVYAA